MKNRSRKVQMTIQNEISIKEVKIGTNLISQSTVKNTLMTQSIPEPLRALSNTKPISECTQN